MNGVLEDLSQRLLSLEEASHLLKINKELSKLAESEEDQESQDGWQDLRRRKGCRKYSN